MKQKKEVFLNQADIDYIKAKTNNQCSAYIREAVETRIKAEKELEQAK